jgi:dihydrofolate reductase
MDWVTTNFSQDMGKYVDDVYAHADTLFLGEVTYKIMASYWPTAETNPEAFQGDAEGAQTMNSLRKVVFSKNLKELAWSNSTLKTAIVPEEIQKLKLEPGKNMLVAGSASVVRQLTHFGLVDEYHLLIHPVILGNGKPLFKGMSERHTLKLIRTEVFTNGVVLLRYEPLSE